MNDEYSNPYAEDDEAYTDYRTDKATRRIIKSEREGSHDDSHQRPNWRGIKASKKIIKTQDKENNDDEQNKI